MTPDPVATMLSGFTLRESSLDPADVLFRAGQASARTPWGWKIAVAGLVLVIAALLGERWAPHRSTNVGPPDATPVIVTTPVPAPEPNPVPTPRESESLWRFGALLHAADPDDLPRSLASTGLSPADPPLGPRSREID
jgi:hypothetical protein